MQSRRTIRRTAGRKTAASRSSWRAPAPELPLADREAAHGGNLYGGN
jgi:hypothetical protein